MNPADALAQQETAAASLVQELTESLNAAISKIGVGKFQFVVLLLGGGVYAAEGSLVLLLTLIGRGLILRWELSHVHTGAVIFAVLIGLLVGTIVGGFVCDRFGRRKPILVAYAGIAGFLAMAIAAPGFLTLFWAKVCLGFFLGFGLPAANAIVCESCPSGHRSNIYSLTMFLFSLGQIFSAAIVWVISPSIDHDEMHWRAMLAVAASLPLSLFILSFFFLQESPYWLVTNRRIDEAREVLRLMIQLNAPATSTPRGPRPSWPSRSAEELLKQLQPSDHEEQWGKDCTPCCGAKDPLASEEDPLLGGRPAPSSGCCCQESWRFQVLFSKDYASTTAIMCGVSFTVQLVYYGMVYGLPHTLKRAFGETEDSDTMSPAAGVFLSALFELPGVFVAIVLGLAVGRRANIGITLSGVSLCLALTAHGLRRKQMQNLGMAGVFGVKLCVAACFIVTYLYLLEVYPTKFRATGLAFCMVVGRLGAFCVPLLYEGLRVLDFADECFFALMSALAAATAALALLLPYETKDAELFDS